MYERWLVAPLFAPWAHALLDVVAPGPGERVLDVACGTGIVARLARDRVGARTLVVGVDSSAAMLAVARRAMPGIDWRQGDAAALPVGEAEQFDVVACQQGLQFFSDKSAAVREMRRALAPHGRLALSVWRSLDEAPFLAELHRLAERRLGPIVDRRHAFGDAGGLEVLLREAELREVRVEGARRRLRFPDGPMFLRMNALALVGMSAAAANLRDDERSALASILEADSAPVAARHTVDGILEFDISANLAAARR